MKNQGREHVAFAASVEPGNAVVSLRWPSAPRRLSPGLGDYACETVASADRIAIDRLRTSLITLPNETDRSAHCVSLVGTKKFLIVTQL